MTAGMREGTWSDREHATFLVVLKVQKEMASQGSGKMDWKRVSEVVKTRTPTQCRTHAQKYFIALSGGKKMGVMTDESATKIDQRLASLHSDQHDPSLELEPALWSGARCRA